MDWVSPTAQEKFDIKVSRVCRWHRWFAWYPVRIYDEDLGLHRKHWLEYVGRRMCVYEHPTAPLMAGGYEIKIGRPDYCREEDVVIRALREPDPNDIREKQRTARSYANRKPTGAPTPPPVRRRRP
jgi:hypothetical protein